MTAHLNPRGDIAIAEIIAYVPILIACGFLIARDGFAIGKGWCYLIVLSVTHIVGGGISIASQEDISDATLSAVAGALLSAGLSSLILSNLAFLRTVCEHGIDGEPIISIGLPALSTLCALAFTLTIIGGVKVSTAKTENALSTATTLRHIGSILLAILVVNIVLFQIICWMRRPRILKARQTLLAGITLGVPFIVVRTVYTVLGAWAPTGRNISPSGEVTMTSTSNSPLAQLNPMTGSWLAYLFMSILTEYAVALLYVVVGARTSLRSDTDIDYAKSPAGEESEERKDAGWRA